MAVNYSNALKTARMAAVIDAIDAHASPPTLEICSASFASVLVSITLGDPSFTATGGIGVITMAGTPKSGVAGNSGTAAVARIKEGGGSVVVNNLAVGVSGADINIASLTVTAAQTVTVTSGTLTHSA